MSIAITKQTSLAQSGTCLRLSRGVGWHVSIATASNNSNPSLLLREEEHAVRGLTDPSPPPEGEPVFVIAVIEKFPRHLADILSGYGWCPDSWLKKLRTPARTTNQKIT